MRRPFLFICIIMLILSYYFSEVKNEYLKTNYIEMTGTIRSIQLKKNRMNILLTVDGKKVLCCEYRKTNDFKIGYIIKIFGKEKNINSLNNEKFAYGTYLKSLGIRNYIIINKADILGKNNFIYNVANIRFKISNINKYLYKDKSDFLNSILIGEKSEMDSDMKYIFSDTGTSHITAVSGFHVGIIVCLIELVFLPFRKHLKGIMMILFLSVYLVLVDFPYSAIRSVFLFWVLLISRYLCKKIDLINITCFVAVLLMINNIYVIYNIGFQLSFLAVISIGYFFRYFKQLYINSEKIKKIPKLKYFFDIVFLSISANILTMPVTLYVFKGFYIPFILSNIVAISFVSVIVYLDILSLITYNMFFLISSTVVYLNKIIIDFLFFLLEKLGDMAWLYIEFNDIKIQHIIFYYIVVFAFMLVFELYQIEKNFVIDKVKKL